MNKNLNEPIRSTDEARRLGQKGGKRSGQARREKKLLRECIEALLEQKIDVTGKDGKRTKMTGAEALTVKLYQSALKGNVKAFEVLRDTAGQKPIDKIMIAEVSQDIINDVEAIVNEEDQ